jgi:hypothetical protein
MCVRKPHKALLILGFIDEVKVNGASFCLLKYAISNAGLVREKRSVFHLNIINELRFFVETSPERVPMANTLEKVRSRHCLEVQFPRRCPLYIPPDILERPSLKQGPWFQT